MCHTIGLDGVSMIGQSEVKEAQGWADETVGWGDTQLRGCSYSFAPDKHRAPGGTGCVGWWVSGGTMYLEERYADMEACYLGGNLYKLHIWLHHLPLLVLFWISQPMHGVSLWRQQNGKKTLKKKRKKRNKCIIGHLSVCHIVFPFWQFTVCETVSHLLLPPCILSLSTQSCWRLLRKRGRMFLFKSCWIGSPLGAAWGFSGFCSSTLNSVGERERPFSVSSLFFFSGDVFVLSNFQFSWHNFSCWFREALSEEPGL